MHMMCVHACSVASVVSDCAILWTMTCQDPLSMGFSRQEHWSGLTCPPPEDLSDPGIEPASLMSPALSARFLTISATWETLYMVYPSWKINAYTLLRSIWMENEHETNKFIPIPVINFLNKKVFWKHKLHYFWKYHTQHYLFLHNLDDLAKITDTFALGGFLFYFFTGCLWAWVTFRSENFHISWKLNLMTMLKILLASVFFFNSFYWCLCYW